MDEKRHSVDCTRRAMTKKRWIVLAGILAACVCLTLAVLALLPPRPGVTEANVERIEDGMTREEVEALLGGPGVSLGSYLAHWYPPSPKALAPAKKYHAGVLWQHPRSNASVIVIFDERERVVRKQWIASQQTFVEKLYSLFGL
jgi:outer membrane protein assembly factor BamE (lipoprotein component of BamABCDE complex)